MHTSMYVMFLVAGTVKFDGKTQPVNSLSSLPEGMRLTLCFIIDYLNEKLFPNIPKAVPPVLSVRCCYSVLCVLFRLGVLFGLTNERRCLLLRNPDG